MLTLGINFRSKDPNKNDIWTLVSDAHRTTVDQKFDKVFVLTNDGGEAYVFYTHEELLEVKADIVRVLNRISHDKNEAFDEEMENTAECARTIRQYFAEGYTAVFVLNELKPQKMGTVAFNIRSDALF